MTTVLDLLEKHQSEAPVNVEALIRDLNIDLEKVDLEDGILGQVEPIDGRFKITVNKADHYFRRRFTMAHELGHVLMHRHLIGSGVDDNIAYRSTNAGKFFNKHITQAHEAQANQFAANLLMPTELVKREWERVKPDLKTMATKFQVSPAAMGIRLSGMGLHSVLTA